jgi:catechol 2,3-dioxygenase-like lactoylglutathione lyase family enzyme
MPTSTNHHIALRVSDIDAAVRFYGAALGAVPRTNPFTIDGDLAEMAAVGPAGVKMRVQIVAFDQGPPLELFEFLEPVVPMAPAHATAGNIIHFAILVDDAVATLKRVEDAGGSRIWAEPLPFNGRHIMYVSDPDGNVIELADLTMDQLVEGMVAAFPEAALR